MHFSLLGLALFSLSTSAIWVKLAQSHWAVIGFWRLALAGLGLVGFGFWRRQRFDSTKALSDELVRKDLFLCLAAGFWFFLHLWTYMRSAQTTSIAHLTLIFSSSPIFTALGAWLWFREKFKPQWLAVYLLAGLGIVMLFYDRANQQNSTSGDFTALISAVLHSAYALTSKKARLKVDNVKFSSILYLTSAVLFLICALTLNESLWPSAPNFWACIAALVILPSWLGHTLFTYLLKHLNINWMSCAKLIEPAMSAAMAFAIFGQELGALAGAAYLMISFAVVLLYRGR
jgi:drug/metabolite transporter (DMT)-like permease